MGKDLEDGDGVADVREVGADAKVGTVLILLAPSGKVDAVA